MDFRPFCGLSCSSLGLLGLSRGLFHLSRGPGGPFGPIQRWLKALFRALSKALESLLGPSRGAHFGPTQGVTITVINSAGIARLH